MGAEQGRRSEGRPRLRLAAGILGRRRQRRVWLGQTGQAGRFGLSTVPRGTRTHTKPWEEDEALGGESRPPKWGKGPTTVPSARPHFLPSAGPGCHREDRRFKWTFPSRGLEVRGDRFQEGQ